MYRVRNGRAAIAGITILARSDATREVLQSVVSDAQGHYRLDRLPPGRIELSASQPGYYIRSLPSAGPVLIVDLEPSEEMSGADFELLPGGVITGQIAVRGNEPLDHATVRVVRVTPGGHAVREPAFTAVTDDLGRYRAFGLEPGAYLLFVSPPPALGDERLAEAYFPGADRSRARAIAVRGGQEVGGIDVDLAPQRVYRVSGKVAIEQPGGVTVTLRKLEASSIESFAGTTDAQGSFSFTGVSEGAYVVAADRRRGTSSVITRMRLEVSGDVSGLTLQPARPAQVDGRTVLSSGGGKAPATILLRAFDPSSVLPRYDAIAPAPDYHFVMSDICPGTYRLQILSPPDVYTTGVHVGDGPVSENLTLAGGAAVSLRLDAVQGFARIHGVVNFAGSPASISQARIAMFQLAVAGEITIGQADQAGRFAFAGVKAGEYSLCAWPPAAAPPPEDPDAWRCSEPAAKQVVVNSGDDIDLRLIPADSRAAGQSAEVK